MNKIKQMKVLITGATGLIGTALTKTLLKNNHAVHYLTTSINKIVSQPNYKGFYWNPNEGTIDVNCIEGVDVIVHLAGASISKRWTNAYKQELIESRLLSSHLLFGLVKKSQNQVKHFISASGTAIYPDSFSKVYDENSPEIEDSFLSNLVVKWEESANQFQLLSIKTTVLRTGIVFSAKGGALAKMVKPIQYGVGSGFGSGKQVQSWIHIEDLVKLYYFVITNQVEGILNAVAPNPISNQELTKTIARILKRPLLLPNIPQFAMKLILGEMHTLLFQNKTIMPKRAHQLGFKFEYDTPEKALNNLLL